MIILLEGANCSHVAQPGKTATMTPSTTTISTVKPRIRVLGPARYLAESTTRPGLGHQVDVLRLKCGCEAGKYGRRCRHLVLAIQYDDWRKRQQAQAAAAQQRPAETVWLRCRRRSSNENRTGASTHAARR